jgi:hypothetical protein
MKKLITNYIFSPSAKQVTFTGYVEVNPDGILLITNTTDGAIIYSFADVLKGGAVSANVLTLTYDTAAMDAGDSLQIWYDDGEYPDSLTDAELRALPLQVEISETNDEKVDISLAMNKANNMPLFTEVANPGLRDVLQAAIPSDAPIAINWSSSTVATTPLTIDTTGYQSIVIHKDTAGIITPTTSNDLSSWFAVFGYTATAPNTMTATLPAATGVYIFPVTGKFFRLTGPASNVHCTIYLRQAPATLSTLGTIGTVSTVTSLKQLNGTDIVNSTLAGSLAVGGAVASGLVPTTQHIMTGGIDQGRLNTPGAVAANMTPKTRTALIDEKGRFILANVDPQLPSNFLGQASALVKEVSQHEGQSMIEVLAHILVELRTLNYQINQLPISIGAGTFNASDDLDDVRTAMKEYNYSN